MAYDRINAIFDQVCSQHLYPLLVSEGYAPTGKEFYGKTDGDVQFRVAAMLSSKPKQAAGSIELAAGVAFRRLWSFIKRFDHFDRTEMFTAAGVGGRIACMFPRGVRPSWYFVDANSSPDALGDEIVDQFRKCVFPFLKHHARLQAAMESWSDDVDFAGLARAAAFLLHGQTRECFDQMDRLIRHFQDRYAEEHRASDADRIQVYQRFNTFLASADLQDFRYPPAGDGPR